jgi:hypothetical protein
MKRICVLLGFLAAVVPVMAYAETPCANVYIYNGTIDGTIGHATPADLFATNTCIPLDGFERRDDSAQQVFLERFHSETLRQ